MLYLRREVTNGLGCGQDEDLDTVFTIKVCLVCASSRACRWGSSRACRWGDLAWSVPPPGHVGGGDLAWGLEGRGGGTTLIHPLVKAPSSPGGISNTKQDHTGNKQHSLPPATQCTQITPLQCPWGRAEDLGLLLPPGGEGEWCREDKAAEGRPAPTPRPAKCAAPWCRRPRSAEGGESIKRPLLLCPGTWSTRGTRGGGLWS